MSILLIGRFHAEFCSTLFIISIIIIIDGISSKSNLIKKYTNNLLINYISYHVGVLPFEESN